MCVIGTGGSGVRRFLTVAASSKRAPPLSGGKRGPAVTHLTGLLCTPLDPVDSDLRQRLQIQTPHELLQTFVEGSVDVKEGDFFAVAGTDYPVRQVEEWSWRGSAYRRLVLEDLKR